MKKLIVPQKLHIQLKKIHTQKPAPWSEEKKLAVLKNAKEEHAISNFNRKRFGNRIGKTGYCIVGGEVTSGAERNMCFNAREGNDCLSGQPLCTADQEICRQAAAILSGK